MKRWTEMLKEPSTYRGLTWLAMLGGATVTPEMTESVMAFGLALVGLIDVFKRG